MKMNRVVLSAAGLLLLSTDMIPNMDGQVAGMFKSKEDKPKCQWAHGVQHTVGEQNINGEWQGKTAPHLYQGGWNASADFIYWRADEDNLEYVSKVTILNQETEFDTDVKKPTIKWSPGFKVGVGYTFGAQDAWDLRLQWTWFETHQESHESGDAVITGADLHSLQPWIAPSFLGEFVHTASADWKLHYNVLDLELGRDYFISRKITARPHFGLRGAKIDQNYDVNYEGMFLFGQPTAFITPTAFKGKNDCGGIGVRAGGDFLWHFTKNWSLTGKLSGSLLYSQFHVKETLHSIVHLNPQTGSFTSQVANLKQDLSKVIPNIDASLGFMWETYFSQNRYHVALALSYEFSEWFSQNQLMVVDSSDNASKSMQAYATYRHFNGDLGLQGATFTARFDF